MTGARGAGPRREREARRLARRRQVRRRRLAALGVLACVTLAVVLGVALAGGGAAERATAGQTQVTTAPRASPAVPQRSPLGSGKPVTLAFGGDIHFESPIREKLAASPTGVLELVAPVLRKADIAVVNLETAVTDRGEPAVKAFTFRAPASAFAALKAGGVDLATVANNHGMDYGETGLLDTLAASRAYGVPVVGAGASDARAYAPHRFTVRGQRIAVLAATQVLDDHLVSAWTAAPGKLGLASAKDVPRLVRAVRAARRTSDTVVVYLHWGLELSSCPSTDQRSIARALVAAGADVVVGSHAHVLLGAGRLDRARTVGGTRVGRALVAYGLGNFVFYAFREVTSQTGVLQVTVTGRRIDRYGWVPARISGGIPYPLSGSARADALSGWRSLRSCTGLRP